MNNAEIENLILKQIEQYFIRRKSVIQSNVVSAYPWDSHPGGS